MIKEPVKNETGKVAEKGPKEMAKQQRRTVTQKVNYLRIYICSGILLLIFLTPTILFADLKYPSRNCQGQEFPLLLNSGLIACEQATIGYIIWTEEMRELPAVEKKLESSGLAWHKLLLSDYSGRNAVKYSTQISMKKENEVQALECYHMLSEQLKGLKVRLYFEERIESALDLDAYLERSRIEAIQKVQTPGITSISGFCKSLPEVVKAGRENVNIQILTKNNVGTGTGKTVLAFPALLEEF